MCRLSPLRNITHTTQHPAHACGRAAMTPSTRGQEFLLNLLAVHRCWFHRGFLNGYPNLTVCRQSWSSTRREPTHEPLWAFAGKKTTSEIWRNDDSTVFFFSTVPCVLCGKTCVLLNTFKAARGLTRSTTKWLSIPVLCTHNSKSI